MVPKQQDSRLLPTGKAKKVTAMLKTIRAKEDAAVAREKEAQVIAIVKGHEAGQGRGLVGVGIDGTQSYYDIPPKHW